MKPFITNTNSLHFKLAKMGGLHMPRFREHDEPITSDLCTCMNKVLWGAFFCMIWLVLGIAAAYLLVETVFSIGFSLFYQMNMFSEIGTIGVLTGSVTLAMGGIIYGRLMFSSYRKERRIRRAEAAFNLPAEEPTFIEVAYRSFKHKYCVEIQINIESEK